jgi:hypothetical protein
VISTVGIFEVFISIDEFKKKEVSIDRNAIVSVIIFISFIRTGNRQTDNNR